MARFCRPHHDARLLWGHPEGRNLKAAERHRYRPQVVRLLCTYANHRGVVAAKSFLSDLINKPQWWSTHETVVTELSELSQRDPDPGELLTELASIWALHHFEPGNLPDDERLTFALAHAVIFHRHRGSRVAYHRRTFRPYQAPRQVKRPTTAYRELGRVIREQLGLFLHQLCRRIEHERHKEAKRRADLREPFPASVAT